MGQPGDMLEAEISRQGNGECGHPEVRVKFQEHQRTGDLKLPSKRVHFRK